MLHARVLRAPGRALPRDEPRPRRCARDARRPRGARARRPVHDDAATASSPPSRRGPASRSRPSRPTRAEAAAAGARRARSRPRGARRRSTSTAGSTEQRFTEEPREVVRGDPDGALAAADVRVELTCETPAHVQTPLEPHAAVARWDGDELTAWVSTQGIFDARRELARRFGLAPEQVRVISEYIGGGFGAQAGRGRRGAPRGRARARRGPPGAARARPPRGPGRRRPPGARRARRSRSARRRDGTLDRDRARRRRRHGRRRAGSSRSRSRRCRSTPARTSAR